MIIRRLAIEDFRVFSGRQEFDLEPRKKYGKQAPIVLFGGLNGAGKTTILTAVLTALYGRQALGAGTSQKAYENFLKESVHKSPHNLIQLNAAKIELIFTFANMGVISEYHVVRRWSVNGAKVSESLKILENDAEVKDLSGDQAQAFLNELIPIGVSDLFFFDGEKIKDLAEDKTGKALADAIRKLLGLDLINRLSADLTLLLRDKEKQGSDESLKLEIEATEKELKEAQTAANLSLEAFEQANCAHVEVNAEIDRLERELESSGGAWIKSRDSLLTEHSTLLVEKRTLENEIRETLGGTFPLSLMSGFLTTLSHRLEEEGREVRTRDAFGLVELSEDLLIKRLGEVTQSSEDGLRKVIRSWRDEELKGIGQDIRHDLTPTQLARLLEKVTDANGAERNLKLQVTRLKDVVSEVDQAGVALSRAPDERALQAQFAELKALMAKRSQFHAQLLSLREERRKHLYRAIETARKLKGFHEALKETGSASRTLTLGVAAKGMLSEFADRATAERVTQLETEFMQSYARLARKEDHHINASIDPNSFDVVLSDESGKEINKNDLSAGEKQIYAIAILEALARTSGRSLPVIIDTPLGRLDSKHREKLREHYFPHASQQVIILSTDTEIDEDFYAKLERDISHSYQLEFDSVEKATVVNKGYFWRKTEVAA